MSKKVVKYKPWEYNYIEVGNSAFVIPVNHPDAGERGIYNGTPVHTSRVISHDKETGRFETKNTTYEVEA